MHITQQQLEACYQIAARVFPKEIEAQAGAHFLSDQHGMNLNSARDYIEVYKHMREGTLRNRWLSASATEYFFRQIETTHGREALAMAISSARLYIDHNPTKALNKLREVVERCSQGPVALADLDSLETAFAASIEKSLNDSTAKRKQRLKGAARVPLKVKATTDVFLRNPDVVAEVLSRAVGFCEGCMKAAPFLRKKDGTPYLEVHHKVQLANGGEDTVQNAAALCPNCHRRSHFGVPRT